jgi:hypothetical protein
MTEHFGEKNCVLVVSPVAAELAAREFPLVTRIVLPWGQSHLRATLTTLRHKKKVCAVNAETVICLRHQRWDYDEMVLSWLGAGRSVRVLDDFTQRKAPELRLYDYTGSGGFHPESKAKGSSKSSNGLLLSRELEWNRQVLSATLNRWVDDHEVIPIFEYQTRGDSFIVVAPFGSQQIRDFPLPLLRRATERAVARLRSPVVLIGETAQQAKLDQIACDWAGAIGHVSVRCRMSLSQYFELVGRAKCVITADSATAHIATACDRPTLVVLGGGHYGQFGPWQRSWRQRWVSQRMDCEWCDWKCMYKEPYCITRITAKDVYEALDKILDVG